MILRSIELQNFRNYGNLSLTFSEGTNIFYGDNAQGKTNLLEAVYMSGTTKSHRGNRDRDMIRFGQDEAHIRTNVEKSGHEEQIDIHLRKTKSKGIAVNHFPIKKASDLFGILNLIFFSPEDLNIIKDGPAERRRFMDQELCQLDKIYLSDLKNYNKALDQRNQLLKDVIKNKDLLQTLDIWDNQLCQYGSRIIRQRKEFVNELNEIVHEIHLNLTQSKEDLLVKYEPSSGADDFEMQLFNARERDLHLLQTTVGPHRDDMSIQSNKIDMRKYGSQGQQRTSALSLKLSEIQLVEKTIHEKPVLLLDDVLSELDEKRQNDLLSSISGIQTLITCTGLDDFVKNRFEIDRLFHVTQGSIEDSKLA